MDEKKKKFTSRYFGLSRQLVCIVYALRLHFQLSLFFQTNKKNSCVWHIHNQKSKTRGRIYTHKADGFLF